MEGGDLFPGRPHSVLLNFRTVPRMQPWENKVLRTSKWYRWPNSVKLGLQIFKILTGGFGNLFVLWPPKTSLVIKFPCLLKPSTYQSGVVCLSLRSPCPLCTRPSLQTNTFITYYIAKGVATYLVDKIWINRLSYIVDRKQKWYNTYGGESSNI